MFRFTARQIPSKVIMIGCGGTGSRLAPLLVQFMRSITREYNARGWLETPTIIFVDDDVVEQKNLLRQNFVEQDVGKHKATVLAQRYGRAYGMNVIPVVKRIGEKDYAAFNDVSGIANGWQNAMVIMCVDSVQARRNILSSIHEDYRIRRQLGVDPSQTPFVIDAGNEDNFGQVRFFNMTAYYARSAYFQKELEYPKMAPTIQDINYIPMDVEYYRNLQDMPSQGSCADLDQTLAINALMATAIMGVVQNFYYVKPFTYNEVSFSLDGSNSTTFNTPMNFARKVYETEAWPFAVSQHNPSKEFDSYVRQAKKDVEALMAPKPVVVEEAPKKAKSKKKKDEATGEAIPEPIPLQTVQAPREIPPLTPVVR